MGFGTGFDMGICQTLLIVAFFAPTSCPSFKPVMGQLVLIEYKPVYSSGHQIFANQELQSKRKICATPLRAGYTEYQPEIISLASFGKKTFVL